MVVALRLVGASSELTCGQFNKLSKIKKDRTLAWALGYVSGMATSEIEDSRLHHEHERVSKLIEQEINEPKLVAAITGLKKTVLMEFASGPRPP